MTDLGQNESPRRWTLTVCPECGLQAPTGYECSGGGDKDHSLNVPVEPVVVVPLADALADLKARDKRQSHWLSRALSAEAKVENLRRAIQRDLDTFGYDNHEGLADALAQNPLREEP